MARSSIPTLLHHLNRPLGRVLRGPTYLPIRSYVYPKEGVFQPNSPPRHIPGFGPAPPLNPYQQQQTGQNLPQPPLPQQNSTDAVQQPIYVSPGAIRRRFLPPWYKLIGGFLIVVFGFSQTQSTLGVLLPYEPGSEEDKEELEALFEELDGFALVQQLRSEVRETLEDGEYPAWQEWTAYQGIADSQRKSRFTTGPLAGSGGVAAQRCFWNEEYQQLFLFVVFGSGVSGWPNVVHGGVISTICDEALGRVAIRSTEEKTAVTANLEIKFLQPVTPGEWYVLAAGLDDTKLEESKGRKKYVVGTLLCASESAPQIEGNTLLDAHAHATASGLFVVPKGLQLGPVPDDF